MKSRTILVAVAVATASLMGAAAMAAGQAVFAKLQPGQWNLNEIGVDDKGRDLCLASPDQFIQLYHPGLACTRYVLDSAPDRVTVHYTCPGKGYGRTTVSVEDPRLIKLDTQGIGPNGQPFYKSYEGRRTGTCGAR